MTNLKIENFDTQKIELKNKEINYKNKSFDNKKNQKILKLFQKLI